MYSVHDKKMIPLDILEILKKHSDENHKMKQKDIREYLENEYGLHVDKKAIAANLERLISEYDEINYDEIETKNKATHKYKNNEIIDDTSISKTNFYYEHPFDESELRLIIDSLLFSKHLSNSQCRSIIDKIRELSSEYFSAKIKYVTKFEDVMPKPIDKVEYNVNIIDEAITNSKKIEFNYSNININKEYEIKKDEIGNNKKYVCTPYQMIATNSRYYMICNREGTDDISHFRIDRIVNIKVLNEKGRPKGEIDGMQKEFDLPKYAMEHIYMYMGESDIVEFEFDKKILNDVVDWFGTGIAVTKKTENIYTAKAKVNLNAMRFWSMQYSECVKVLAPQILVDSIKKQLQDTLRRYEEI